MRGGRGAARWRGHRPAARAPSLAPPPGDELLDDALRARVDLPLRLRRADLHREPLRRELHRDKGSALSRAAAARELAFRCAIPWPRRARPLYWRSAGAVPQCTASDARGGVARRGPGHGLRRGLLTSGPAGDAGAGAVPLGRDRAGERDPTVETAALPSPAGDRVRRGGRAGPPRRTAHGGRRDLPRSRGAPLRDGRGRPLHAGGGRGAVV